MGRRTSSALRVVLAVLLLVAVAWATHVWWLTALGSFLVRVDSPQAADAAVVLGGDETGARILQAADLVKRGFVPRVLVSGPPLYGIHECDLAIDFAIRQGCPRQWFVPVPHQGLSTAEEARLVLDQARRMQIHRLLLVTSNYHTRRAGKLFRSVGNDLDIHVVEAPNVFFAPDSWWRNRQGQKYFFMEWAKTIGTVMGL